MTLVLRTRQLTKAYGGETVVSDVNMNVRSGEIYGFLGPNGAGKTTIMKMITNLVQPTAGEIEVFGEIVKPNSYELLKRMSSIIEYPIFYEKLSAWQNLELHAAYTGTHNPTAISKALEAVNLTNVEEKPVKEFSLGMKQRLGIARAIMTKPELLILDEPVNGLDPVGMLEIRDLFINLSRHYGVTILVSSHILGQIEQIADTIGVVKDGRLLEEMSLDKIKTSQSEHVEMSVSNYAKAATVLEQVLNITNYQVREEQGLITIYDNRISQSMINQAMVQNGIDVESITKKNMSLEDHFLTLIEGEKQHA
ncbi:ABC transporter ATP-binding protein [Sporosarcina sp. Te-1]|uniref:ABC transporter ATP-binding protein n=1 Tax=Sporosarcina sp. Te-1 TaxID=2818390 RepID=UPI001A9E4A18|nr:ABC transporter ATP-binding protein [Sporosarcina sp. Te-1]QTD39520.1 ABC transporter ATP-binding protein [Sporosarcina sp. Te-1]